MTAEQTVADAMRTIAMKLEHEVDGGQRRQQVTMNDMLKILLAIADRIDPPAGLPEDPPY